MVISFLFVEIDLELSWKVCGRMLSLVLESLIVIYSTFVIVILLKVFLFMSVKEGVMV